MDDDDMIVVNVRTFFFSFLLRMRWCAGGFGGLLLGEKIRMIKGVDLDKLEYRKYDGMAKLVSNFSSPTHSPFCARTMSSKSRDFYLQLLHSV